MSDYKLSNEFVESWKQEQKKQERLYHEYKKEGLWKKNRKLGELNPTHFTKELKDSIPKEEFQELLTAHKKEQKIKLWLGRGYVLSIFGFILTYLIYTIVTSL